MKKKVTAGKQVNRGPYAKLQGKDVSKRNRSPISFVLGTKENPAGAMKSLTPAPKLKRR